MYPHLITEQIETLKKAGMLKEHVSVEAAAQLLRDKHWTETIAITWNTEDIQTCAEEQNIKVTEEEAKKMLQKILHTHDASRGVNWNTIERIIQDSVLAPPRP